MKCILEWFYQTIEYQSYLICISLPFFFSVHHSFYILESLQHGHFNSGSLKFCYNSLDYKSYTCVWRTEFSKSVLAFFIQRWGFFSNLVKLLHSNCICLLAESISADSFVPCTKPLPGSLGVFSALLLQIKAICPEYESASLKLSMLCGILKTGC